MKRSLLIAGWVSLIGIGFSADQIPVFVKDLEAEDFKVREAAVEGLAKEADQDFAKVAAALWKKGSRLGPEGQARIPAVLRKVFERQCLGIGEATTGITLSLFVEGDGTKGATAAKAAVTAVQKDSLADKAGLKPGDVILSWNGAAIEGPDAVIRVKKSLRTLPPDTKVSVKVSRHKISGKARLDDKGTEQPPLELVLGEPRKEPATKERKGSYLGWLEQVRIDHELPAKYSTPQP